MFNSLKTRLKKIGGYSTLSTVQKKNREIGKQDNL